MRLVLWDIDGTLIDSGGAGRDAFGDAFEQVVGRPMGELATLPGRTDHEIALETFELNQVEGGEELWPDFSVALGDALGARADEMRANGRALPGVFEAVAALAETEGVVQSLLTGNVRPNAAAKLGAFGLGAGIDLDIGAYGSDDRHRPALVDIARGRAAEKHGREPVATVLVGDTPRDVGAGLAGDARVVGVATGSYSVAALEEAGAHAVLTDLSDTDAVVAAVLDGHAQDGSS